ncbi:hypothetical protein RI367_005746 [Sorochytrium milnesiophthora]
MISIKDDAAQSATSKQQKQQRFTYVAEHPWHVLAHCRSDLEKWGLAPGRNFYLKRFQFDVPLSPYQTDEALVWQFLRDPDVLAHLEVITASNQWAPMRGRVDVTEDGGDVQVHALRATVTRLDFFDRLWSSGVVRRDGSISACLDRVVEADNAGVFGRQEGSEGWSRVLVSDRLRACLVDRDEDAQYGEFAAATDRQEVMFHVLVLLVLGGRVCQYDDAMHAYVEASRQLYKDLVRAQKAEGDRGVQVSSSVFQIVAAMMFPVQHVQNRLYVSVDRTRRSVVAMYHGQSAYEV